jgi:hypothetical protein
MSRTAVLDAPPWAPAWTRQQELDELLQSARAILPAIVEVQLSLAEDAGSPGCVEMEGAAKAAVYVAGLMNAEAIATIAKRHRLTGKGAK